MNSLSTTLRRQLESACKQARAISTAGAGKALKALAVHESDPYCFMDERQRDLRGKLRAQAKQLGDREIQLGRGEYEINHLVEKLAYDQWHRLLFARFLLENNLLISQEHEVCVTLGDCEELAPSLGLKDAWSVAVRFASKELPEIFRDDDPVGAVELPAEDRNPLIEMVTGLPMEVFTAQDSLGWCYQFWQAERKESVNAAGNTISADELPAVTQLFTEAYMVDFLLDNTLGAWHASKVLATKPALAEKAHVEEELREAVALPRCPWRYLRFIKAEDGKWSPAAGGFNGWPVAAKELTCLDPCMGSGHFVVAMFERLVALRMAEEKLDESAAVHAVISNNLFGLEIDPRCTQIAAFNLALAAWRRVGHHVLPAMNLACSGLAPNAGEEDWLMLASNDDRLRNGVQRLYHLFQNAPVLGSLINPRAAKGDLLVAEFHDLQPLLETALAQELREATANEMAVTAKGLAKAAEILASQFTLVATNVPYLGRDKQDEVLKEYGERVHPAAKADLASCFVERSLEFCSRMGTSALVTPQSWLYQDSFKAMRPTLLKEKRFNMLGRLGPGAFEGISGEVVNVCLVSIDRIKPGSNHALVGIDVSNLRSAAEKRDGLVFRPIEGALQTAILRNPHSKISLGELGTHQLLSAYATSHLGICTGDYSRFGRVFWELPALSDDWSPEHTTVDGTCSYGGMSNILLWQEGRGDFVQFLKDRLGENGIYQWLRGQDAWNRRGVIVSATGKLSASLYLGDLFDNNVTVIVPINDLDLPAVWAFCASTQFHDSVRRINQALKITDQSMIEVPFDIVHWEMVAAEKYRGKLPHPFSSDPSQWIFDGHPKGSDQPLHVAVARLVGYDWPRLTGSDFPNCRALNLDGLEEFADEVGIVCLSATQRKASAAERLRELLARALGKCDLNALTTSAGPKGSKSMNLEEWLRDEFFEQHCSLFKHRPFIWHIWDGHKGGFSALLNYHKLSYSNLETLTYAYLGDWIRRQRAATEAGEVGGKSRLQAAEQLQARLKLILEGEPPYDTFVRWKPLSKQAIGWQPDLKDGVRTNIRPFATADTLRKRVKIKWDKDRGHEPFRDKKEFPWFWGWDGHTQDFVGVGNEPDGNRWNDCHYTNEFKKRAREENKKG